MNYLAHFVLNHDIWRLPVEPYFVTGVALPDLWLRFSRRHRIRWKSVRAAAPTDCAGRQLRAGLLNHADVDRHFHALPAFCLWQQELRRRVDGNGTHPALLDFLAHVAVELALDHHVLRGEPHLPDRFYDVVAAAPPEQVAQRLSSLTGVAADGLTEVLRGFVRRRFLRRYASTAGLANVLRIVLQLAEMPAAPDALLHRLTSEAVELVRPTEVWVGLPPPSVGTSGPLTAGRPLLPVAECVLSQQPPDG